MSSVPDIRIQAVNTVPVRADGTFVLYWMTAARRAAWNYGLDRAIEHAIKLGKPLVVLEPLRIGYRWASDRLHRFVLDGMADNRRAFAGSGILYHPYVEPAPDAGRELLLALSLDACVVVTDDFPAFFLPRMVRRAGQLLSGAERPVRLEAVDSSGIFPIRAAGKPFHRAFDLRRFLQKEIRPFLSLAPSAEPLSADLVPISELPSGIEERWPAASPDLLGDDAGQLARLDIDHTVLPVPYRGGRSEGERVLTRFLEHRLPVYESRNQPEQSAASGLSPYLHFGHVSSHEVLSGLAQAEGWSPTQVSDSTAGKRSGWWGMSAPAESFLDQLVTWRELGLNACVESPDQYADYESLPEWARTTLEDHALDPRPHVYSLDDFESAATHDPLWNAAQNQLRIEGRIHNYLRMLWGKKILHWSESPRAALEIMIGLNDKYAVDGRDPNSYSGIQWVLGRYDRPWGPERPVFGKIRYMSSANTRRKVRVRAYVDHWNGRQAELPL